MIDSLVLALTHGLLLLTAWQLISSPALDDETPPPVDDSAPKSRWGRKRA